ncbi:MAG: HD domain-containing protein, partial [Armatimonadota bacterium]
MSKKNYVENLVEGVGVNDTFLISSRSVQKDRNGKDYIRMTLRDRTGQIAAVRWNASESEIEKISEIDYVLIEGCVTSFQGQLQLNISRFSKSPDDIDPTDYIDRSQNDPIAMMAELMEILSTIQNPQLTKLLELIFEDKKIKKLFMEAPAAEKAHHAYIGGLLEHTLNVVKNAASIVDSYKSINRDLLLTSAALHDIGKIYEFSWERTPSYTENGRLVGHLVGGVMLIKEKAEQIEGFEGQLSDLLQHAVLSHHGCKEWGSPVEPMTIEALVLHCADDLDAKINMFEKAIEAAGKCGKNSIFTPRHTLLNRYIYMRPILADDEDGQYIQSTSVSSDEGF